MYNFLTHPCPHKDLQACLQPMLNAIYSKRKKKVKTIQLTLCFFYFIGSLCTCYCFLHAKEALLLHMYLLTLVNYYMYFIHTLLCIKSPPWSKPYRPLTTKLLKSLPQAISLLDGQHLFALYPKKKTVKIL